MDLDFEILRADCIIRKIWALYRCILCSVLNNLKPKLINPFVCGSLPSGDNQCCSNVVSKRESTT